MNMIQKIIGTWAVSFACVSSMTAYAYDDADKQAITTKMDALITHVKANDIAATLDILPPAILDKMVAKSGISSSEQFKTMMAEVARYMGSVNIELFDYDLDNAVANTSPTGRDYVVMPTTVVMSAQGKRFESTTGVIALEDNGSWYVVRVEKPSQLDLVKEVYPDLSEITLPASSMKEIK